MYSWRGVGQHEILSRKFLGTSIIGVMLNRATHDSNIHNTLEHLKFLQRKMLLYVLLPVQILTNRFTLIEERSVV